MTDLKRIIQLRQAGYTLRRIAADQSCSHQYVQKVLNLNYIRPDVETMPASGGVLVMSTLPVQTLHRLVDNTLSSAASVTRRPSG
jgi:hypothetical protein